MADLEALTRDLEGLVLETHPAIVRQKSRDFFWFSPGLKQRLNKVSADLVVNPRSEEEVARVLAACHRHGVPVTPRGAGTGNYGQAMPLSGGVILHLAGLSAIKEIGPGRAVLGAGAVLADIDRAARAADGRGGSQEIRMFPSTYQRATVGGFIAGGSAGIGSIRWGGLRELGNIARLRLVTMEAEPRILELTGHDLHKATHAYGTNGIITEVEIPLTQSFDWVEVILGFDEVLSAAAFGRDLGHQDGILTKLCSVVAAPVAHDYFKHYSDFIPRTKTAVIVMVAPHALDAFLAFAGTAPGAVLFRSDRAAPDEDRPPVYELTWNHTTLQALKVDKTITYLQTLYPGPDPLARVQAMIETFGDEVPIHLEFTRHDGLPACIGLPLVRYSGEARLEEIIGLHEDAGVPVFNPHRFTLEEGGMKQTDAVQLAFKRETDPQGLLNPGKMIAWENPDHDFASDKPYLFPGLDQGG